MVTDLYLVDFHRGPPQNFKKKNACVKSNGFMFFLGNMFLTISLFRKCFPNLFFPTSLGVVVKECQTSFHETTKTESNHISFANKSHPRGHQICLRFSPSLHSGYLWSDTNIRIDEAFQPQRNDETSLFL